jgi:hypothetical protein
MSEDEFVPLDDDPDFCDPQAEPSFEEEAVFSMSKAVLARKLRRRGLSQKGSLETMRRELHRSVLGYFTRKRAQKHNQTWFGELEAEREREREQAEQKQNEEQQQQGSATKRLKRVSFVGLLEEAMVSPVQSTAE